MAPINDQAQSIPNRDQLAKPYQAGSVAEILTLSICLVAFSWVISSLRESTSSSRVLFLLSTSRIDSFIDFILASCWPSHERLLIRIWASYRKISIFCCDFPITMHLSLLCPPPQMEQLRFIFFLPPYAAAGIRTHVGRVATLTRDLHSECITVWATAATARKEHLIFEVGSRFVVSALFRF